jgi:hypothetical protein
LSLNLEVALVRSDALPPDLAAQVAWQEACRQLQGHWKEYRGIFLFVSPSGPGGLQMLWLMELQGDYVDLFTHYDLAAALSRETVRALYVSYLDATGDGQVAEYINGEWERAWSGAGRGEQGESPLDEPLHQYFRLSFDGLQDWFLDLERTLWVDEPGPQARLYELWPDSFAEVEPGGLQARRRKIGLTNV